MATAKKVRVGMVAPDFTLRDGEGVEHTLSDYRDSSVLIFFYPKDNTPGCTTEAMALRDEWKAFKKRNIVVLGISTDSQSSHKKFSEKLKLPFSLLSDEDKRVVRLYRVWGKKKFMGREYMGTKRYSFLIGPDGKVAHIYEDVKPKDHAAEVLADADALIT